VTPEQAALVAEARALEHEMNVAVDRVLAAMIDEREEVPFVGGSGEADRFVEQFRVRVRGASCFALERTRLAKGIPRCLWAIRSKRGAIYFELRAMVEHELSGRTDAGTDVGLNPITLLSE